MRGQRLEEPQVVVVEGGEALVAVEGDESAEGALATGEGHDHGATEVAEERVDVRIALVVPRSADQQAGLSLGDGLRDRRRAVNDRPLHR